MARVMKDSGNEWIGEIPETWKTDRLQWHLNEVNVSNSPIQSENILSLTIEAGVIPYEEKGNQGNKSKENYEEYKLAYPDTLVVNSMNVIIGAVGISKYFGCVSPVYYVFKVAEGTDLRYIYYLFTNVGFQKEMRKHAKGILEIRLRISSGDMLKLSIPNPSYEEQQHIADFLDRKCAEIDAVIEKTKATIEEYKKLKQSVITEAVTKGIRGNRPMKDSGIEWIGEIPEEWEWIFLKYVTAFQEGPGIMGDAFISEGVPLIRISGMKGDTVSLDGCNYLDPSTVMAKWNHFRLQKGDIVISASASMGMAALVDDTAVGCIPYTGLIRFPTVDRLNNMFLRYFLISDLYMEQINVQKTGSTIQHYGPTHISKVKIALPNRIEQDEIATYLDDKCAALDTLITKKTALLTELETYKKSLIYEYVTGKKEV